MTLDPMNVPTTSRRDFLAKASLTAAALASRPSFALAQTSGFSDCPIAVFSKIYQVLKLDYQAAADLTAEAGLDGIDCPVRSGGEIDPTKVAEELPRYASALAKRKLKIHLLTTGITSASSPHAEAVLRAARALGIRYYRLGAVEPGKGQSAEAQAAEIRDRLKTLVPLNKDLGVCALFQNHSGSFGANLPGLVDVVKSFDPGQVGVAFDIGHALLVHGTGWSRHFEELKSHLKVAYVKDARHGGSWVSFGEGDIPASGYFHRLKELGYHAPFSLHIEFDWDRQGREPTRQNLLKALRDSRRVLGRWLQEA